METKFSVLLSLYNKENPDFLKQSLESIFNQTLKPTEIILVEDGPLTSKLYEVLNEYKKKYPEFKTIPLKENKGLGVALNEGLKHCSYELVARMDTDDICKPNRFEKQVNFMNENPEISASSAWMDEFINETTNIKTIKKVPLNYEEISSYIKKRNPLNHPSVIFRKSDVIKAEGYKHFPLFEDWFLWARMFKKGKKFANISESLLFFRTSPDMYRRRGGVKYAKDNFKFQFTLYNLGIKSLLSALIDSGVRGGVYLLPNKIREFIYTKFLRS